MGGSYSLSTAQDILAARNEVLSFLRSRDPSSFATCAASSIHEQHVQIAESFLSTLEKSGFALEIVSLPDSVPAMFEGRWTHQGAVFVGFKQPPAATNPEDASLLACAALLRNDWCRSRLPASS